MLRALGPVESMALIPWFLTGRSNEARPIPYLGRRKGGLPFQLLLEPWSPRAKERRSWVWLDKGRIAGVVSLKRRCGAKVWEMDCLASVLEPERCLKFLDRFSLAAAQAGVERVFLRLSQDSPLLAVMQDAGFHPYRREHLFSWKGKGHPRSGDLPGLRPKMPADDYLLFRLFLSSLPPEVHRAEGCIFQEWQETRQPGHGRGEFVYEQGGAVRAWLRLLPGRGASYLELLYLPGVELREMVNYAVTSLNRSPVVLSVADEAQPALRQALREEGFQEAEGVASLVKVLVAPVRESLMVPMEA